MCAHGLSECFEIKLNFLRLHINWMDGRMDEMNRNNSIGWDASEPFGAVYALVNDEALEMPNMDTHACNHTPCPIRSSNRQTYQYALPLAKKFPVVSVNGRTELCHEWNGHFSSFSFSLSQIIQFRLMQINIFQRTYIIKWILRKQSSNQANPTSDQCCFQTRIKLTK